MKKNCMVMVQRTSHLGAWPIKSDAWIRWGVIDQKNVLETEDAADLYRKNRWWSDGMVMYRLAMPILIAINTMQLTVY